MGVKSAFVKHQSYICIPHLPYNRGFQFAGVNLRNYFQLITWNTNNQEELTWWTIIEDNTESLIPETIEEKEEQENQEVVEEKNEVILEDDYPLYWVLETDYWDETISEEDENDPDLQETEKLLMQALSEWSQEENNVDL